MLPMARFTRRCYMLLLMRRVFAMPACCRHAYRRAPYELLLMMTFHDAIRFLISSPFFHFRRFLIFHFSPISSFSDISPALRLMIITTPLLPPALMPLMLYFSPHFHDADIIATILLMPLFSLIAIICRCWCLFLIDASLSPCCCHDAFSISISDYCFIRFITLSLAYFRLRHLSPCLLFSSFARYSVFSAAFVTLIRCARAMPCHTFIFSPRVAGAPALLRFRCHITTSQHHAWCCFVDFCCFLRLDSAVIIAIDYAFRYAPYIFHAERYATLYAPLAL